MAASPCDHNGVSGDLELSYVYLMLGVLARLSLLTCPHLAATLAVRLTLHPMAVHPHTPGALGECGVIVNMRLAVA